MKYVTKDPLPPQQQEHPPPLIDEGEVEYIVEWIDNSRLW
jgi:hypothetical protein